MGIKSNWYDSLDMGWETGCVWRQKKTTQVAPEGGCREGKAEDQSLQTPPSLTEGGFFSCIRNYKYIYEVVTLQSLKKSSFLCLIQIHCGGALWKNGRNSVIVRIIQCVFAGWAQENEYKAETGAERSSSKLH